ncbi:DivIVA domain [Nocardia otitidiscaviarum]|uniref:DivIVA domain n=1 Tax=Nocardia otitidiscaviarum TaxID=1823 RepID=A0A378Y7Q5_9NOCA|nr:DivIVA domain [Nocardia otitidiscaviarum]
MLTLLLYVLIVGLVAALLFLVASAVFGRSEELGPLPEGTTATVLPVDGITGGDVRALRFQQVLRGYKAGEVDWALTRLAARIDELEWQLAQARAGQPAPANGTSYREHTATPHRDTANGTARPDSDTERAPRPGDPVTRPVDPADSAHPPSHFDPHTPRTNPGEPFTPGDQAARTGRFSAATEVSGASRPGETPTPAVPTFGHPNGGPVFGSVPSDSPVATGSSSVNRTTPADSGAGAPDHAPAAGPGRSDGQAMPGIVPGVSTPETEADER